MKSKRVYPQGYQTIWTSHAPQGFLTPGMANTTAPQGNELFPSFWLPFADLGSGVVDTTEFITRATPTFTRTTTAWTRLSTGLWASVASGSPRSYYNADGTYAGFLAETAITNRCLWSRDLTQAGSWTPTNVTPLKNITGIDGVANSASRITSTAGNGTILQSIASASVARTFSCWMKRLTGTGKIYITLDNDATRTEVTSSINSSTWSLVQATQTLANPTVGFKIETSGDAVAVDMCQEESKSFATTPMPDTDGSADTRNADVLTYPLTGWYLSTGGVIAFFATPLVDQISAQSCCGLDDGTAANNVVMAQPSDDTFRFDITATSVGQANLVLPGGATTRGTQYKIAMEFVANDAIGAKNGSLSSPDTSVTIPTVTRVIIYSAFHGCVSNFKYFPRRLSNSQLQAITA